MALLHKVAAQLMRQIPSSKAFGLAGYWRDLDRLDSADVALVSFPKSGRTFVRVMLARLYQKQFGIDEREVLKFATLREAPLAVPRILFTHNGDAMRRPGKIAINRKAYRGRKVVLLARHPGDIIVSRYYHLRHRSLDPARQRLAQQPLEDFIWTKHGGIPSIVRFLNQWKVLSEQRGDILILRYEDFLSKPELTLRALSDFVGLKSSEADITEAVEFARFDNLRQKEREGYFSSGRMGPGRAGNQESYKVRSGKSGGFRAKLSPDEQSRVEAYFAKHLDPSFGYSGCSPLIVTAVHRGLAAETR
ncbi:sulfotransferase domain-containing protein [Sphingomonas sp. G124]|uniref:Sulfotransferase domain-containing protein n=1 Tax=Sphingomonas cremea TaxID=2904799 RepID=A0A9X1QNJ9_9SPHN|nr:sulfotransferase domain-containing protein [Sphingomonas cremea]MCF2514609.1 sulfotransferase domain-containing protein [Sphingomonas cremea]